MTGVSRSANQRDHRAATAQRGANPSPTIDPPCHGCRDNGHDDDGAETVRKSPVPAAMHEIGVRQGGKRSGDHDQTGEERVGKWSRR